MISVNRKRTCFGLFINNLLFTNLVNKKLTYTFAPLLGISISVNGRNLKREKLVSVEDHAVST